MTYTFKLSRRIARIRAPMVAAAVLFSLAGCNPTDTLTPDETTTPDLVAAGLPQFSVTRAPGIPIGTFGQPNSAFGAQFNGALRIITPDYLLSNLAEIRAAGGRVMLNLAGSQSMWRDAAGHFSMSKWKARIDRYRGINFSSYINDGTIIGHYLIDEPNDPGNWSGTMVSQATVEQMAQYSKQLWPNMATAVRAEPGYMAQWNGTYRYLDAAWAQYVTRKGTPQDYLSRNLAAAQKAGLQLVVGLNVRKGGPNETKLTASQIKSFGATMMASAYPCAFLSWEYTSDLLGAGAMRDAQSYLRSMAENRPSKTCRNGSSAPAPAPPPPPAPAPAPAPAPTPAPAPAPAPGAGSLPFGLFYTPMGEYSPQWTATVYRADPEYVADRLGRAQSIQMKMVIMLSRPTKSKNPDGTFSLTKWKAQVDRFRGLPLGSYISNRTFYLHNLVDQPNCSSCWGGNVIPWETVEEMARYSKSIWPTLPTATRAAPSKLATASFRWSYLDAGWIQYNTSMGDLRTYLASELSKARQEGLGFVAGLNLQHAAGGSSGAMTASEIKAFGTLLASDPSVCAMVGYRHDPRYLGQTGIRQALDSVASVAKRHPAGSCVVN